MSEGTSVAGVDVHACIFVVVWPVTLLVRCKGWLMRHGCFSEVF